MADRNKKNVIFIFGLVLLSLLIVLPSFTSKETLPEWWPSNPINLGLDLRGGSYLVLGVKTEEAVKSQLANIAASVRSEMRKEKLAKVMRAKARPGNKVQFTLLGEKGINELIDHVKKEYPDFDEPVVSKGESKSTVEFRLRDEKAAEIEKQAVIQAIETIRNRVDSYGVAEPTIQRTGGKRIMVQLPAITNLDQVKKTIGSVAKLEFRLVSTLETPRDEKTEFPSKEGGKVWLNNEVLMTGDAIKTANGGINPQTNEREIVLKLNGYGRKIFDRITAENVGRQLAIVLDGIVQTSPVIREQISGGVAQISGSYTNEEVHRVAVVLRSGALPASLTFEEERTVGASLGKDSIAKGIKSMVIGSVMVILFMIFYYKKSGVLAVSCLTSTVLFLLALLALVGATLTLPGIAGLILTVGMAVDANVIIFERIREELRNGATARAAIDAGFMKAHWTILDANITTLLTGIILLGWGTGPIKGFAVTLCLGVLTSMFSALYVAKVGFANLDFGRTDSASGKKTLSI